MQGLLSVLAPSNRWLHDNAPIKTWLQLELMRGVSFDCIRDMLLTQYLPEVLRSSNDILVRE